MGLNAQLQQVRCRKSQEEKCKPNNEETGGTGVGGEEGGPCKRPLLNPIYIDSISEESSSEEEDGAEFEQFTDSWSSSDSDSIKKPPPSGGVAKKSGNKVLMSNRVKPMNVGGVKGKGKMRSLSQSFEDEVNILDVSREEEEASRVLPDGWNGQELTMYRMLQNIFGHNYCAMAQLIQTKTCQQVCYLSHDSHVTLYRSMNMQKASMLI